MENLDTIIITGSGGFVGEALVARLIDSHSIIGLDRNPLEHFQNNVIFESIDLASDKSVQQALEKLRRQHNTSVASVIHLASYFDLTGEPNLKYEEVTVRGTERLLRELQSFEVDQFVFASSMLAHKATNPGEVIDEERPLEASLPYRASKIAAERLIHLHRGNIPVVYLRPAGVYDDLCHNPFLAHQIARIYEEDPRGHIYPGDLRTGQSFLHVDDLVEAIALLIHKRDDLPPELSLLLGEPDVMGYGELQSEIGRLIHGAEWETWEVPKPLAKAGTWVETDLLGTDPFIRSWMVDIADDHYAVDISRARNLLRWEPKRSLRATLPKMIAALKADPVDWYRTNKLNVSKVAGLGATARKQAERLRSKHEEMMPAHRTDMDAMHFGTVWTQFFVIALGAWLLTSPLQFALLDPAAATTLRDISAERGLWDPALRNALTGWSDIVSGILLMVFGTFAVLPRFAWIQWGTAFIGLWLLFAPLVFWTPSAAAYANDMIVGALAITFSVLVPMMPGMSHEGMMDESTVPPGWTYSPSSWLQRLPIIALALIGLLIARYLAAYQFGQISAIWEPFFSGADNKNGSEFIITSDVSRAWPIADAGLGATSYMLEALMGAMGTASRWRTMPWMVAFFFILVVPLGGVSIFFIIIQPIMIGTYCTLCLIAAAAMLIMIPLTLDEVVAMGQYMLRSIREGRPFWRTFFQGGADPSAATSPDKANFSEPIKRQVAAAVRGVTVPWTLAAICVLGVWLMFSRLIFGTEGAIADNDHLIGALLITVSVCAMAEVARPLRLLNLFLGAWLIAAPWLLSGADTVVVLNDVVVGLVAIGLSLPRGQRSTEHYGAWDRYVF
ncbi:NAD-dependent epimerase/dehydratase family protein [Methyloceanibacter sp.]|uniref:NAD-dependent epimerase/dehydratase family protein n=1 Tax=Methyloceanibacter sp. TaxID=1965321 RepID=UPI002CE38FBD|nr:NAD-dependent epimerase/dehydratase family protein [Methyloceanibacter sp.]HML93022.1 NAD-dependent epimerase/dehydratase family protein [Methyloceanibacter sp.]